MRPSCSCASVAEAGKRGGWRGHERSEQEVEGAAAAAAALLLQKRASERAGGGTSGGDPLNPHAFGRGSLARTRTSSPYSLPLSSVSSFIFPMSVSGMPPAPPPNLSANVSTWRSRASTSRFLRLSCWCAMFLAMTTDRSSLLLLIMSSTTSSRTWRSAKEE